MSQLFSTHDKMSNPPNPQSSMSQMNGGRLYAYLLPQNMCDASMCKVGTWYRAEPQNVAIVLSKVIVLHNHMEQLEPVTHSSSTAADRQLLPRNLTPLPHSHTWAACQQPTVCATHGRLHSRCDDTKYARSIFHHKRIRRWAASQWRSVTLSCVTALPPPPPPQHALLHCRGEAVRSEDWEILRRSSEFWLMPWWPTPATLLSPFSFFCFGMQTEREVLHRAPCLRRGCLATGAEQRLRCHGRGCRHRSRITLHWDSKKEKEWNRDEGRGESEGGG